MEIAGHVPPKFHAAKLEDGKNILEHPKKIWKKFFVFIFSFNLRPIVKLQKWVNGKSCSVNKIFQ